MKNFTARYIFLYISALVLGISLLLSLVFLGLKPKRELNQQMEKSQQILKCAGYDNVKGKAAIALFTEVARPENLPSGREAYAICCADGDTGKVVYVNGKGLWGPIWGYVLLASDRQTIKGVVFSHKSETPGLGANITTEKFASSFEGKKIYDENGEFVSVTILPKGRPCPVAEENRVDAISGATITSLGVSKMLYDCLKEL